jgi:multidrug efflux pump subunit AcrA (membrane-fusion protein)
MALALGAEPPRAEPEIPDCMISSIDGQAVPAANAGVLASLTVKEGTPVKKGQEIGRIDDSEAKAMLLVKQLEYQVAKSTADSNVEIQAAQASADVAQAALAKLKEANSIREKTFTAIDILKAELEWRRAVLAIAQAKQKNTEAGMTANAKKAEEGAAEVALGRHILRAPFDGIVTIVSKKPGEWVAAGDPVVQVVGINKLRVIGGLDPKEWGPTDVEGRKVTVNVALPQGKSVAVPGKITFVSPVVVGLQEVVAEIETPMKGDLPLVRAGLPATMTIHVNQPVVTASSPPAPLPAGPVRPTATKASATTPAKTSPTGSKGPALPASKPAGANTPASRLPGAKPTTKK